jgi:DNA-binding IclR family transcriptional regulator
MQVSTPSTRRLDLPAQPNRSVIDALSLLQLLAGSVQPLGVRELGRSLGWNAMRVNRLLKTLAGLGLARQTPDRRYLAGPAMHVLSIQSLYASGLLRRAIEAAKRLPTGEHSVALGVLWQDQVCYLFHTAPGQQLTSTLGTHSLHAATRSSVGMVLLAAQPREQIDALFIGRSIPGFKALEELHAALDEVRDQEMAYVIQSPRPYMASVAVPIGTPAFAGLALATNITRDKARQHLPALRHAAGIIAGD